MAKHETAPARNAVHPALGLAALALSACVLPSGAMAAADWVSIAKADRTEVFANPASLGRSPASWVILRTKQNFVEPQPSSTVFGEIVDYAGKNVPAGVPPATK